MQYNFKTQELQDKGVNFASIFPEKQSAVKEMTGFDFDLSNIVLFLKKETDNFSKTDNPLASELDKYIYSIYLKYSGVPSADKKSKPKAEEQEPTENKTIAKLMKEIADVQELMEMEEGDDDMVAKLKKEISDLNDLIEMEQ
jgi:hypothetical protein